LGKRVSPNYNKINKMLSVMWKQREAVRIVMPLPVRAQACVQ